MNAVYGDTHHIIVGDKVYQIQSLDTPFNSYFVVRRSGQLLCTISMDDEGEWQSDRDVEDEKLTELVRWIKRLYGVSRGL
jgi:hypothetical protein